MRLLVAIERSATGYGVWSPEIWGCVALARSRWEAIALFREAALLHMEATVEDGGGLDPHELSEAEFRASEDWESLAADCESTTEFRYLWFARTRPRAGTVHRGRPLSSRSSHPAESESEWHLESRYPARSPLEED